jgi:diguanylate cyclase (GGDEF)-like protein
MKLRHKIFFSTTFIWTAFLLIFAGFFSFFLSTLQVVSFIGIGILFYLLIYGLLYIFIIKRLEKLYQNIIHSRLTQHVNVSGDDEIAGIASQINNMMDVFHQVEEKFYHRTEEQNNLLPFVENELTLPQLTRLAHYDNLTSLPNRVFFNEMLSKLLHHAQRHNKIMAILFIDLDRFRVVNEKVGREMGDQVLKQITFRFTEVIRNDDLLARIEGDEFIILLNDINHPKIASSVAEKILQDCSKKIVINEIEFSITASIGICIFPDDGTSLEDLQKHADLALYKAKHIGGGVYEYFSKEMTLDANKHIKLKSALNNAILNKEFLLYYQPKLNLENGSITGVEALIRWANPEIGIIGPVDFIKFAEDNNMIMPISEWVLREACIAVKSWHDQGYPPISVAVNLSSKQFSHHDLPQVIENVLINTGLDAKFLELEITETTMMEDVSDAINKLREIKKTGVKICIDDFGTGYTSIGYLKQFPIDILKIDKEFISGIPSDQNDKAITSAIIALGHNLGMDVVAEGVETVEQLQFLTEHKCDLIQGYYFSRPLPEQKMLLLLSK